MDEVSALDALTKFFEGGYHGGIWPFVYGGVAILMFVAMWLEIFQPTCGTFLRSFVAAVGLFAVVFIFFSGEIVWALIGTVVYCIAVFVYITKMMN